jgi:hypothetical protein
MRCGARWAWLLAAAAGVCAAGCTRSGTRKKPEDPLLMSKPPVQAKFGDATEVAARPDPSPPAVPAGAWVAGPAQAAAPVRLGPPDFQSPSADTALSWSSDRPRLSPVPASRGLPPDTYARAADYRWLQGVLERAPGERWLLRYEAVSRDGYGGKVFVEGHPRLDLLEPGDVVRVEGALADDGTAKADPSGPPRYRVRQVRLIKRHP